MHRTFHGATNRRLAVITRLMREARDPIATGVLVSAYLRELRRT